MKRAHDYRIWFPQAAVIGKYFNELCETCQDEIDEFIREGVGIPMGVVAVDTGSAGNAMLYLGSYLKGVELCPQCTKALKEWIDAQEHFGFDGEMLRLQRTRKEEEAKE